MVVHDCVLGRNSLNDKILNTIMKHTTPSLLCLTTNQKRCKFDYRQFHFVFIFKIVVELEFFGPLITRILKCVCLKSY